MSRTDVHAPYRVKARDPLWSDHFREFHDHRRGPCDLAAYLSDSTVRTRCRRDVARRGRNVCCGCRLCTGYHEQRAERRRDRHGWRRAMRREGLWDF